MKTQISLQELARRVETHLLRRQPFLSFDREFLHLPLHLRLPLPTRMETFLDAVANRRQT